ncbi:MAG: hypothetical protein WAN46_03655 [Gammaproteobacteria bacterium]|jgi:hypothetical protein
MAFDTEPVQYQKTALSDLQGAWGNLRDAVVESVPFPEWERLLFHIDEGMSWESVRNLERMRRTMLLIENIVRQSDCPSEVEEWVDMVRNELQDVLEEIAAGKLT